MAPTAPPPAAAPSRPLIATHAVSKSFGAVRALDAVSTAFSAGEVHCLAGENGCGKSTLIKVVSGAHAPTSGTVSVDGQDHERLTPRQALDLGIEVIYQDFSLLPNLSTAENIALPTFTTSRQLVMRRRKVDEIAEAAVERLGVRLDLRTPVGELTVADRQLCAVARALAHEARFLAMDEPTTALTWREVESLFDAVRRLRTEGVAIAFISHKLQEVFDIADRVTIMRNGRIVETGVPGGYSHDSLTERMTGRTSTNLPRTGRGFEDQPPALSVRGLQRLPLFADVSFKVDRGEIVGLAGLLGSGRTEIAEAIAGVRPATSGSIEVAGRPVAVRSVADAITARIGYVPEDRLTQGLFLDQPIEDNLLAVDLARFAGPGGRVRRGPAARAARSMATGLRIKARSLQDSIRTLSGGNAQRVLIGKWLVGEPEVLILNGPTVGVDVGSKFDILSMLHAQSLKGLGVLMISDDVPELVATCDRVLVVRSGRLVAEIAQADLSEDAILSAISAVPA